MSKTGLSLYGFAIIENTPENVKKVMTPYGNREVEITDEDMTALKEGKLLFFTDGEYGTFVSYTGTDGIVSENN